MSARMMTRAEALRELRLTEAQLRLSDDADALVRRAYRRAALREHPDRHPKAPGRAAERFQRVHRAYQLVAREAAAPGASAWASAWGGSDEDGDDNGDDGMRALLVRLGLDGLDLDEAALRQWAGALARMAVDRMSDAKAAPRARARARAPTRATAAARGSDRLPPRAQPPHSGDVHHTLRAPLEAVYRRDVSLLRLRSGEGGRAAVTVSVPLEHEQVVFAGLGDAGRAEGTTDDLTRGDLIVDVRAAQGAGASRGYSVMRSPQGHRELHLTVALRPAELWRASTIWVRHLDGRAIRVHVRDNLYARLAARAVDRGPETIAKGFAAEAAPPHATAGSSLRRLARTLGRSVASVEGHGLWDAKHGRRGPLRLDVRVRIVDDKDGPEHRGDAGRALEAEAAATGGGRAVAADL
jgi:hypothetical protein